MPLKAAAIQLNADDNKAQNIAKAVALVERAADHGAKFIALPEVFNCRAKITTSEILEDVAEPVPGPSIEPLMRLARQKRVAILAGSILERTAKPRAYNTSVLIAPSGKIQAVYRKKNLFDAQIGKKKIRESHYIVKGDKEVVASVAGFKVGLSICYDLRFPDHFRACAVQGAQVLCVPSSFTKSTGQAHWETLLRARAIENLCYVIAPNQTGKDGKGVATYGNSMIIDPWGKILVRAGGAKEEIIYATLDHAVINQAMQILPSIRES